MRNVQVVWLGLIISGECPNTFRRYSIRQKPDMRCHLWFSFPVGWNEISREKHLSPEQNLISQRGSPFLVPPLCGSMLVFQWESLSSQEAGFLSESISLSAQTPAQRVHSHVQQCVCVGLTGSCGCVGS